jgi:tRNA-specific 2-thiouridylase
MTTEIQDSTTTAAPVFVALSGGVDSAVAACLLKEEHANLIGISHRHWPESRCCSTVCIDRCAEQCEDMGIPYSAVDCIVEFAQQIVDNFVASYERGVTPNPCVLCNEQIRFDLMVDKYYRQKGEDPAADFKLATGHYARVAHRDGRYRLRRGIDPDKDQSYMLHRLSQRELSRCIFPLGNMHKAEVRAMAEKLGLKSAKESDSQDICFVQGRYQEFIQQYSETVQKPGPLLDREGNQLGEHEGIAFYTRGQRSGLGLNGGPWYVVETNLQTNQVVVGRREDLLENAFTISDMHWGAAPRCEPFECVVQTRYRSRARSCIVEPALGTEATVRLSEASEDVTPGQSAVFYEEDWVVGGGIIQDFTR